MYIINLVKLPNIKGTASYVNTNKLHVHVYMYIRLHPSPSTLYGTVLSRTTKSKVDV